MVNVTVLPEGVDPNTVVTVFPRCAECGVAYVLRRCFTYAIDGLAGSGWQWLWMRDCKHKKVHPEIVVP